MPTSLKLSALSPGRECEIPCWLRLLLLMLLLLLRLLLLPSPRGSWRSIRLRVSVCL